MPGTPLSPLAWMRRRARALPFVAWRDEKIRKLQAQKRTLAEQLAAQSVDTPSFHRHTLADRRVNAHMADRNHPDRGNLVARKLKAYSFAQSHGVRIPTLYGLWQTPEDIAWATFPEQVVIKTNTGTASRGVFPLRRVGTGWSMVTTSVPTTPADVVERLQKLRSENHVAGPFFAEELLGGGHDNALPVEVRVSAFYGEISHVLLRRVAVHGDTRSVGSRRITVDGSDAERGRESFEGLPVPGNIDELLDVARRLSLCIPRPYVRIDLYDIDGEVVFGELTPRPGNPTGLGAELDRRMGELWEQAEARVLNHVIDGGDYRLRFGSGPRQLRVGDDGVYVPERGWSDA